jgi:hypothetical protein
MSGVTWLSGQSPDDLAEGIQEYAEKVKVALYAVASKWGQEVQDSARIDAPWQDRTGHARSGIFYAVDGLGMGTLVGTVDAEAKTLMSDTNVEEGDKDLLIIVVSHTVFYGKFLETKNGGRYAIIMSNMEENLPRLESMMRKIFKVK